MPVECGTFAVSKQPQQRAAVENKMNRKIAIVGAGQSGLQMALGLLSHGYEVTLVNNRTAEQIRTGKVMSSQCMFDNAVQIERDLGINYWDETCPPVEGIGFAVPHPAQPGEKLIGWAAELTKSAQSVDQRVKIPLWMNEFEKRGGTLIIEEAGVETLEKLADTHDLVLVAAGKGDIVRLFERDAEKSFYDKPQRALALTYVKGMTPNADFSRVAFNLIPGVGEYFVFPALTTSGPCEIMVFEGVPGGPMDCWQNVKTPEEHLAKSLEILNTFLPWEADRCKNVTLTDDNGILSGSFAPTVRKPVATLPSGKSVFGIADVVVVNDPITGQGSNNASKCSKVYLNAILENGNADFTPEWMQNTFETYWNYAANVTTWTNTLLGPPPAHILNFLGAAGQCPSLAGLFANAFNDPNDYFPWWLNPEACEKLVASHFEAMSEAA